MILKTDKNLIVSIGVFLLMLVCICSLVIRVQIQQKSLEILEGGCEAPIEHEQSQEDRIWDLHRRVKALEAEDERLLAHIKWFVMRRSGTNELRKMEAVVARLEATE